MQRRLTVDRIGIERSALEFPVGNMTNEMG